MELFDVVKVEIKTGKAVEIISEKKTEDDADFVCAMANIRQGLGDYFFDICLHGKTKIEGKDA